MSSPDKYASRGRPGAKARIDAGIKVIMGRYIVERGIAVADAEKLAGLVSIVPVPRFQRSARVPGGRV